MTKITIATPSRPIIAALVSCSVVAAAAVFALAAAAYPGGTHFDHHSRGHAFWGNTLCDVARSTAIGGAPNAVGAALARAAMTIMVLACGAHFWLLPATFPSSRRLGNVVRVLGSVVVPAGIAITFLPTDRFGAAHAVAIVFTGIPGLTAMALAVVALLCERVRPWVVTIVGVLAMAAAAATFGIYVEELVSGGPPRVALPVLERVGVLFSLAWVLTVARAFSQQELRHSMPCSRSLL